MIFEINKQLMPDVCFDSCIKALEELGPERPDEKTWTRNDPDKRKAGIAIYWDYIAALRRTELSPGVLASVQTFTHHIKELRNEYL